VEGEEKEEARFADLFGPARKAGRLGWVERRRAESRTRFKRKVLRVNGAEVMPRPQQQQPSLARLLARSFRSLFFTLILSLSLLSCLPLGLVGEKESAKLPLLPLPSLGFSLLLKHTLSSCLFPFSFRFSRSLVCVTSRPFPSEERAAFSLPRFKLSLFFLPGVVSSHPRDGSIFSSRGSYHEQSLTSASNASCRRNFFHRSALVLSVCTREYVYVY